MSMIPSIAGTALSQFLHGISKLKTSLAAGKAQAPTGFGAPPGPIGGGGSPLISQIEATVTQALQAAKASGSTADPNQTVEDAISSLLKGIWSGKSPVTSPTPVSQQAFESALQSAGITPQQFHADLRAAVEDAQDTLGAPASSGATLSGGATLDVTG